MPEDAPTIAQVDAGAFGDAMTPVLARIEPRSGEDGINVALAELGGEGGTAGAAAAWAPGTAGCGDHEGGGSTSPTSLAARWTESSPPRVARGQGTDCRLRINPIAG